MGTLKNVKSPLTKGGDGRLSSTTFTYVGFSTTAYKALFMN